MKVVEAGNLALDEGLEGDVVERPATPQRERLLQLRGRVLGPAPLQLAPSLRQQPLEAVRVETFRLEPQLVTALAGDHQTVRIVARSGGERLAQAGDVNLHGLGRGGRRALPPELVDQPVGAECLVGVQQKQRQQCALLAPAERDRAALVESLKRAEDAEVHARVAVCEGPNPTYTLRTTDERVHAR